MLRLAVSGVPSSCHQLWWEGSPSSDLGVQLEPKSGLTSPLAQVSGKHPGRASLSLFLSLFSLVKPRMWGRKRPSGHQRDRKRKKALLSLVAPGNSQPRRQALLTL